MFSGIIPNYQIKEYQNEIKIRFPSLIGRSNISVLDIGANIGDFSLACRKLGFKVLAVEPQPFALSILYKRSIKDGFDVIPAALTQDNGNFVNLISMKKFSRLNPRLNSLSSSTSIGKKFFVPTMTSSVLTVSLEKILEFKSFDLIKIDIEGAEEQIIDHLIRHADNFQFLIMEKHEKQMKNNLSYINAISKLETFIISTKRSEKWKLDWI